MSWCWPAAGERCVRWLLPRRSEIEMDRMPEWLTYPGSSVRLGLRHQGGRDTIDALCNPNGLGSLVNAFLWLTSFAADRSSISISALPFVRAEGPLSLSVTMTMNDDSCPDQLVRLDRDRQFEWRTTPEHLKIWALALFRIATTPEHVDWFDARLSSTSDAELHFEVTGAT